MYIVDASVVVERLIRNTYTPNAQALFQRALHRDKFFIPEFGFIECVNVLWKSVRFQNMPLTQAQTLIRDLKQLPLQFTEVDDILEPALNIGIKYQLAVYDSIYIALAQKLNKPLITLDQKQSNAAQSEGVTLLPLTQFT